MTQGKMNLMVGVVALTCLGLGIAPACAQTVYGALQTQTNFTSDTNCVGPTQFSTNGSYIPGTIVDRSCSNQQNANATFAAQAQARGSVGALGVETGVDAFNAGNGSFPTVSGVTSRADISWDDMLTINSQTLAAGTQVALRITSIIDIADAQQIVAPLWDANSQLMYRMVFGSSQSTACFSANGNNIVQCQGATLVLGRNIVEFDVMGTVGTTYDLSAATMGLSFVGATAAFPGHNYASLNALGTAHTYVSSMTAGAAFSSQSGHDYALPAASAVPEPATWATLIGGFGATGLVLRRRKARPDIRVVPA